MILIASGNYVVSELESDVGRLPPTFLPIAGKRLYEYQIAEIKKSYPNDHIDLSIPKGFHIQNSDNQRLQSFGTRVHISDPNKSLGEAIHEWITFQFTSLNEGPIRLLWGDTLIKDIPKVDDVICCSKAIYGLIWEKEEGDLVWNGYFSFSNANYFKKMLEKANFNFVEAVRNYSRTIEMKIIESTNWLDFGHVSTFYKSRTMITSERHFNDLKISSKGWIEKSSCDKTKIKSEFLWFDKIPGELKIFLPQTSNFIESVDKASYQIEYLPLIPLNELYVQCRHTSLFWKNILKLLQEMLSNLAEIKTSTIIDNEVNSFRTMILVDKTKGRLNSFLRSNLLGVNSETNFVINGKKLPPLEHITSKLIDASIKSKPIPSIVHGDLCFSNILFDSRAYRLKLIDPRGIDEDSNLFGDQGYDLSKLYHSIVGFYDFIISGKFKLSCKKNKNLMEINFSLDIPAEVKVFSNEIRKSGLLSNRDYDEDKAAMILLFITMLPLHNDDTQKQLALLANALVLFSKEM